MLFIIIDNNAINAINQVMAQATQAGTIVEKDGSDESMLLRLQGPQSVELWVTAELLTQNNPSPVSNAPKENPTPVEYEPTHLEVVLPKKTETHDEHRHAEVKVSPVSVGTLLRSKRPDIFAPRPDSDVLPVGKQSFTAHKPAKPRVAPPPPPRESQPAEEEPPQFTFGKISLKVQASPVQDRAAPVPHRYKNITLLDDSDLNEDERESEEAPAEKKFGFGKKNAIGARTKMALLQGLRNGSLEKAVEKMEADTAVEVPGDDSSLQQQLEYYQGKCATLQDDLTAVTDTLTVTRTDLAQYQDNDQANLASTQDTWTYMPFEQGGLPSSSMPAASPDESDQGSVFTQDEGSDFSDERPESERVSGETGGAVIDLTDQFKKMPKKKKRSKASKGVTDNPVLVPLTPSPEKKRGEQEQAPVSPLKVSYFCLSVFLSFCCFVTYIYPWF